MRTVRSDPRLRLAAAVVFIAFAGACDGCRGCGCGPTQDGGDPSAGAVETELPDTGSPEALPTDLWASVSLPLTASREPLPGSGGPQVVVSTESILIRGETTLVLADGGFAARADEVALMNALRDAFAVADTPSVAIAGNVDTRVGLVVLDTLVIQGAWPQLVGRSPAGDRYRIPFSVPDPAPDPEPQDIDVDHSQTPFPGPDREIVPSQAPPTVPMGRPAVQLNAGPPVVGQRSPAAAPNFTFMASVHPAGIWLMGGTIGNPMRGFRAITARSREHPSHPALQEWQSGMPLADWFNWAELASPMATAASEGERRSIAVNTQVYVEDDLPFEMLVRLLDLITWAVPEEALAEGADFESGFLGADQPTELLPVPAITLPRRLPGE